MKFLPRSTGNERLKATVSKQVAKAISAVGNIVLSTHVRPDGDALGSLFGFADILETMGKRALCYLEEPVPDMYRFLPRCDRVETDLAAVSAFVRACGDDIMGICLDCGDLSRLGRSGPELKKVHPFLVIDHHQGNNGFGDLFWIEPHRSSTGEMIYDLALEMGATVSKDAADCLYTAIVTDTGSFQYDSTTDHTFAVAGELTWVFSFPAATTIVITLPYSPLTAISKCSASESYLPLSPPMETLTTPASLPEAL